MKENEKVYKPVVFVGCENENLQEQIDALPEQFGDGVLVINMTKNELQDLRNTYIKKTAQWRENESISEYIRKPENIKKALEHAEEIFRMVKELAHMEHFTDNVNEMQGELDEGALSEQAVEGQEYNWHGWFNLKQVVEATTLSYTDARRILNSLYTFGMCLIETKDKVDYYRIFTTDDEVVEYLELVIGEKKSDIKDLNKLKRTVIKEGRIVKTKAKMEVVTEEDEKTPEKQEKDN